MKSVQSGEIQVYTNNYFQSNFQFKIPTDTVIEYDLTGDGNPQLFDPVYITSISINNIEGLPMGFNWECTSQDLNGNTIENSCSFPGGGYGCLRFILTVPNVPGTYPLNITLDIVASYEVFGLPIPVEVTDDTMLNGIYTLVVNECSTNENILGCTDTIACNYTLIWK